MPNSEKIEYIKKHMDSIPIRVNINGLWKTLPLSKLPPELQDIEINRLLDRWERRSIPPFRTIKKEN